jgi:protein-disulfide isomerase
MRSTRRTRSTGNQQRSSPPAAGEQAAARRARQQRQGRRGTKLAARQRRRSRRTAWLWTAAFLAVAVAAGIGIQALRTTSGGPLVRPAHALGPADGEVIGQATAPVTVEEYGDFQCPHCRDFQEAVGPTITQLVKAGKIRFVYHPMAFLGPESVAASNAATCAGDEGKFWPYHDLLFAEQAPVENSGFLSTGQLLAFGRQLGLTDSHFVTCVRNGTYVPWSNHITDEASQRGVNATPTILVNGQAAPNATTSQGLLAAVNAAANS